MSAQAQTALGFLANPKMKSFVKSIVKACLKPLIRRGGVSLAGDDSKEYLVAQAQYFGRAANFHVIYPYGFCGNPPVGSLSHVFLINGNEENKAGIANLDPQRFKDLEPWEVALGNYKTRSRIKFLNNGDIEVFSANDSKITITNDETKTVGGDMTVTVSGDVIINVTGNTTINCPLTKFNGDVTIDGTLTVDGINHNTHLHDENDSGGPTDGPRNP